MEFSNVCNKDKMREQSLYFGESSLITHLAAVWLRGSDINQYKTSAL